MEHGSQTTPLSGPRRQLLLQEEEDEEEDDDVEVTEEEEGGGGVSSQAVCVPLVQGGWGKEEEEEEEEEMAHHHHASGGGSHVMPINGQAHMAHFMLDCFSRDPRVVKIMQDNLYWAFALLDPRYKDNLSTLIPADERTRRVTEYTEKLLDELMKIFKNSMADGGRGESVSQSQTTSSRPTATRGTLSKVWDTFMAPPRPTSRTAWPNTPRKEKYKRMLRDYMADKSPVLPDPSGPYTYWVSKLDTWHELSLYALEVLACPAASVLSERVFSAAGGIITDKRSRLSTDSADRLTLIKMNSKWIAPGLSSLPVESSPQ